jgi:hypothetical protein
MMRSNHAQEVSTGYWFRQAMFDIRQLLLKLIVSFSAILTVVDLAMTGWADGTYPAWMVWSTVCQRRVW